MIVGAISLHSQPPLPLIPSYLLACAMAIFALQLIRESINLQPAYRYIIQSQIFANLGGVLLLSIVNIITNESTHTAIFYLEIIVDSLFHFASLCYVIVAVHRFIVIGQDYSERKWTDRLPFVIALTAIFAVLKTTFVRFTYESIEGNETYGEGQRSAFISSQTPHISLSNGLYSMLLLGCPLLQICIILSLDSVSFRHLRFFNAQISDRIASNKNVEWRLLTQSLFSCVPNLIFVLLLLLIPNLDSYGELTRSMATTGLQMFDVMVDSLVIIIYSKPYGYFRARTSDSISVDSDSNEESQF
ncbi:hypothetical protein PRIPAC_81036 [Pristionchus pacificus]|uniref:Uncharacterized protein n=1 Tax=Pristionchus pacificus TaxID=54126 RepID=A0A2A6C3U0_PRIPA|nr:hypothetical protein PRIPAC_81036 [Pristionchus pacificus]|eukprot:PDM72713.1 hypothetical protein PRIPAC_39147 [Pristionchus pacificus]